MMGLLLSSLFLLSFNSHAHGDVHQRIEQITQKLAKSDHLSLRLQRALLWLDDGDFEQAWKDYQSVLERAPENTDALFFGAQACLSLGKMKTAETLAWQFEKIVQQSPENAPRARASQLLSDLYLARHEPDKALSWLKKSLQLQYHPTPDRWLALADLQAQQTGYSTALSTLKKALVQYGENISLREKIIALAMAEKDYPSVLQQLDIQLKTSGSLRKVLLLLKKSDVLSLMKHTGLAKSVRQQAKKAFQKIPAHRKNQPAAKQIQQQLQNTTSAKPYPSGSRNILESHHDQI